MKKQIFFSNQNILHFLKLLLNAVNVSWSRWDIKGNHFCDISMLSSFSNLALLFPVLVVFFVRIELNLIDPPNVDLLVINQQRQQQGLTINEMELKT